MRLRWFHWSMVIVGAFLFGGSVGALSVIWAMERGMIP